MDEPLQVLLALAVVLAPLAVAWWLLRDRKPRQAPNDRHMLKR